MEVEDVSYRPTNREKARNPSKAFQFWCMNCDLDLVQVGSKCPHCGSTVRQRKDKKTTFFD